MPENRASGATSIDDETLVRNYVESRDDTHFIALYDRYAGKVFRRCLSFCRSASDAEDLTQEIFIKVYASLHRFRGDSSFSTWVYRIATNHCLNFLRNRKEFRSLEERTESPRAAPGSPGEAATFQDALEQVPRATQTLLLLKFRDGYTYEEISDATGLGESAVKMRISRARKELHAWKES